MSLEYEPSTELIGNQRPAVQTWGLKVSDCEQVIEDREFPIILEEHVPGPNLSVFLGKRQGSQLERRSISRTLQNVLDLF
jgi:hypothetical protein